MRPGRMFPGGRSLPRSGARSPPAHARNPALKRSAASRSPVPDVGGHSSSNTATGLKSGERPSAWGRTSFSQTSTNGSARRRSRGRPLLRTEVGDPFSKPVGGGSAENQPSAPATGLGEWFATQAHEKPHLLIGDMPAGQRIGPLEGEADPLPAAVYRQMRPLRAVGRRCWGNSGRATPSLRQPQQRAAFSS